MMKMLYGENFGADRAINGRHFNPRRNIEPKIWRGKNSHLKQTQFSVIIFFFLLGNLAATTTTSLTAEVFLTRKFPSSVWRWIKLKSKNWVLPLLVYLTETYTHLYKPCNLVTAGFLFIYLNEFFLSIYCSISKILWSCNFSCLISLLLLPRKPAMEYYKRLLCSSQNCWVCKCVICNT